MGFRKGKGSGKVEQWLDEGMDNENQPGNSWGNNPVMKIQMPGIGRLKMDVVLWRNT